MQLRHLGRFVAVASIMLNFAVDAPHAAEKPSRPASLPVAGLIETATIFPDGIKLKAKLDTGARTSSLGAQNIRLFARESRDMVRFTIRLADGTPRILERPLYRLARIKEHGGGSTSRPVVLLSVCIGNVLRETQVNLQNRDNFRYALLIGRRFLAGAYVVDPAREELLRPDCSAAGSARK